MIEKKFNLLMFGAICVAIACFGWYCFSLGRATVHSDGTGIATVGGQLESARESATMVAERIERISQTESAIRKRLDRVESVVIATGKPIEDSQRIIAEIRKRGKI